MFKYVNVIRTLSGCKDILFYEIFLTENDCTYFLFWLVFIIICICVELSPKKYYNINHLNEDKCFKSLLCLVSYQRFLYDCAKSKALCGEDSKKIYKVVLKKLNIANQCFWLRK